MQPAAQSTEVRGGAQRSAEIRGVRSVRGVRGVRGVHGVRGVRDVRDGRRSRPFPNLPCARIARRGHVLTPSLPQPCRLCAGGGSVTASSGTTAAAAGGSDERKCRRAHGTRAQ